MVSRDEFERANARGARRTTSSPIAVSARYDRRRNRVIVALSSGIELVIPPESVQGLQGAKTSELEQIEISPSGFGLHFPKLDADLYLPALLEGFLGSRRWIAARLGRKGGEVRSEAKAAASRANGKLGGRPKRATR
jgi:hypothetical protein